MAVEELIGHIPDGWTYTTLGKACADGGGDIQTGPFGSQLHAADYVPVGVPSIMPQNIGDNRISEYGIARITPEDATRLSRYLVREGDIVYSRRGDVEKRALIRANEDGWLCGTGCLRVRLGDKGANPSYAAYYLGHPSVREWIVRHAHGATMPNLNTSILSSCPFVIPPSAEQRAIAHILGTMDDKIELNRRRNQTLEAMARALFKDWFVDFGPVRAKMEGREAYLPADLWQLFPDHLDDEGKPEGWRHSTIGDEVTVCGGSTPSTKEPAFWEGGEHRWATPKDLAALTFPVLLDTDRKITDAAIAKISSGLLPVGTVLLSSRAPIGYLAIAEVSTAINQGFIAMKCNGALPNVFVLFWCRENMDVILGNANGSTFQEISKSNFRPIPVIVPPELILNAFRERTGPLYRHIVENERESRSLAQLRDTLLPKLISGELRIKDAEKFLEDVA